MFEGIAKRKLEKEVAQLLGEKGAAWCLSHQQVWNDLLQKHPAQKRSIEALHKFLAIDGWAYLINLPNPAADKAATKRVAEILQSKQSLDAKTAQWVASCWANAMALISPEQRAEFPKHRAFLISCWQVAFPNEAAAIQTEAKRVREMAVLAAESEARAQAARLIAADPRWGMPVEPVEKIYPGGNLMREGTEGRLGGFFSEEQKRDHAREDAIKQKEKDANKAREEAERPARERAEQERRVEHFIHQKIVSSSNTGDTRLASDNEIWRRIQVAPNQAALRSKLEEVAKAKREQARVVAERQRAEEQQKQKLQSEANERRRVEIEKSNQLKAQAAERQRIEIEKRKALQAEVDKRLAPIREAENERRMHQRAIEYKQSKIQKHRQNFPLQCVGFSDEEIWEQIEWL